MLRRSTALLLSAGLIALSACDSGGGLALGGGKSAEAQAVEAIIREAGYFCDGQPETLNFIYDQSGAFGNGSFKMHYQINQLDFTITEENISAADRQNGVTFSGWIMFDENTTIRQRELGRQNWLEWRDWSALEQSDPVSQVGYQVQKVDGNWTYRECGWQSKSGSKLLEDLFKLSGLRGRQSGRC